MEALRSPLRIGPPAAASLLVNGLLLAALLNLGTGWPKRVREAPALTVMSFAVLKGAADGEEAAQAAEAGAPAPPAAAAPAAQQQASPLPPPPQAQAPAMQPQAAQAPAASAPAPAQAAASAARPAAAPAAANAPAAPAAPVRRGAADGLDTNAPAGTSRAYAARVRSWLYGHKIYPRRAKMRREEGVVRVRFVIDRAGLLVDGRILQGSGCAALDEEAMAMMRRASPYPKAPHEIAGERIEFTTLVEFILPAA